MARAWNPEEVATYDRLFRTHTDAEIAQELGTRSAEAVNHYRRSQGHPKPRFTRIPMSNRMLEEPLIFAADSVLALFDIHCPYQDATFIRRCVDLARQWDVRTCVLGGDVFDMETFSKFGHAPTSTLEQEMADAEDIFGALAGAFEDVYFFLGNHEARLIGKTLEYQLAVTRWVRLFTQSPNVHITDYEWCVMETSPEDEPDWLFVHPKSTSVIHARVPALIADARGSGYHLAGGHGHLWGHALSRDGERHAIDAGMCADPKRLGYYRRTISTRPAMNQGALLIKDRWPWTLRPDSPWEQMARLYSEEADADGIRAA